MSSRSQPAVDGELGDEQSSFIEGCPQSGKRLPEPAEPLLWGSTVDMSMREKGRNRKAVSFEIIVGKSMTEKSSHPNASAS